MNAPKIIQATLLSALLTVSLLTGVAYAITGNFQPDSTGTYVGLVVFYTLDAVGNKVPVGVSSGILLSPRVVLTAAHSCVTNTAVVCFDQGPITWSVKDGVIQVEGVTAFFGGIAYPNPDYATNLQCKKGVPAFSYHDLAVVILEEPVPTSVVSQYAQLPSAGLVDTLSVKTEVTVAGYGFQYQTTPRNSGVQNTWAGPLMRNNASARLLSNNFAWSDEYIRCSANPSQGKGGIAFGDSGGPVLLGQTNTVLAVTSYVTNPNCAGETYHNRIDTSNVLDWINKEVSVNG
jgi:hypothetical protein